MSASCISQNNNKLSSLIYSNYWLYHFTNTIGDTILLQNKSSKSSHILFQNYQKRGPSWSKVYTLISFLHCAVEIIFVMNDNDIFHLLIEKLVLHNKLESISWYVTDTALFFFKITLSLQCHHIGVMESPVTGKLIVLFKSLVGLTKKETSKPCIVNPMRGIMILSAKSQ